MFIKLIYASPDFPVYSSTLWLITGSSCTLFVKLNFQLRSPGVVSVRLYPTPRHPTQISQQCHTFKFGCPSTLTPATRFCDIRDTGSVITARFKLEAGFGKERVDQFILQNPKAESRLQSSQPGHGWQGERVGALAQAAASSGEPEETPASGRRRAGPAGGAPRSPRAQRRSGPRRAGSCPHPPAGGGPGLAGQNRSAGYCGAA